MEELIKSRERLDKKETKTDKDVESHFENKS